MFPVLLSIGPITIYTYGIFLSLAFVFGTFTIWHYGRKQFPDDFVLDFILIFSLLSLLGGRIAYIIINYENFGLNILKMLHFFNFPGFSFYWGLLSGITGGIIFTLRRKASLGITFDAASLGFSLALIFGSLGSFFNGNLIGKPASIPWAMTVLGKIDKRHPVALYELITFIILYLLLIKLYRYINEKNKTILKNNFFFKNGTITLIFFLLFGLSQFLLEFFIEGSVYWGTVNSNQLFDLGIIIATSSLLLKNITVKSILDLSNNFITRVKGDRIG